MYIRLGVREMYNKRSALIVRYPNTIFFYFLFFFYSDYDKTNTLCDARFSVLGKCLGHRCIHTTCVILFTRSWMQNVRWKSTINKTLGVNANVLTNRDCFPGKLVPFQLLRLPYVSTKTQLRYYRRFNSFARTTILLHLTYLNNLFASFVCASTVCVPGKNLFG